MPASHNIPAQLTSFIGRERELALVSDQLAAARLLTLVGAGGVGKTRLALRVAESLMDIYPDGIWLVELAALNDGSLVPQAVAIELKIPEIQGRPLRDSLVEALRDKRMLLLLDNCEHLLEDCAHFADRILRACPLLHILATSRESLGIAGEVAWRVPSLALPDSSEAMGNNLDDLCASEAVQLFVERTRLALPDFDLTLSDGRLVIEICQRLDGMPLAIELAAARMRLLAIEQIAARLDDRFRLLTAGNRAAPTRQQTLRATIEWSYNLLSAHEQQVFDRLSIFAGGWTLEAAEAITSGDEIATSEILELLGRLIDKSLVLIERSKQGIPRYRLLETLRQYGAERLYDRGEREALATRHALYFMSLAEQAENDFFGPREAPTLARMALEQDNVRGALRWLIVSGDTEHAQRLCGAFGLAWFLRSSSTEGRTWLEQVLSMARGELPTAGRALCLLRGSTAALAQGDHTTVELWAEEALTLWRRLGNARHASTSLYVLGVVRRIRGDYPAARQLFEECLTLAQAAGNRAYCALSRLWLADMAIMQGDFAGARAHAEAAIALATAMEWSRGIASCLRPLADACFEQHDDLSARAFAEETVAKVQNQVASPWWLTPPLVTLARVATAQHDFARAHAVLAQQLELVRTIGDNSGIAAGLQACAYLAAVRGQFERAVCMAAAGEPARHSTAGTMVPVSARVRRQLESAASALGASARAAARRKGRAMSLDDAITYALAIVDTDHSTPNEAAATQHADGLTAREREVTALVAHGLSNLEIASQLVISERTVESHVRNALGRLGLRSRERLASWATEHGLLVAAVE